MLATFYSSEHIFVLSQKNPRALTKSSAAAQKLPNSPISGKGSHQMRKGLYFPPQESWTVRTLDLVSQALPPRALPLQFTLTPRLPLLSRPLPSLSNLLLCEELEISLFVDSSQPLRWRKTWSARSGTRNPINHLRDFAVRLTR